MAMSASPTDLHSLTVGELRKIASAEGIPEDEIEDARDGDSPKGSLIELIEAQREHLSNAAGPPLGFIPAPAPAPAPARLIPTPAPAPAPAIYLAPAPAPVPIQISAPATSVTTITTSSPAMLLGNLQPPLAGVWCACFRNNSLNPSKFESFEMMTGT